GQHHGDELDRPPAVKPDRDQERGQRREEPRLDASSQRVRHVRSRKRRAAYFAPAIVSAAGNAHCPATPAIDNVRRSSVSWGTVEPGARTIHRSWTARSCSSTRRDNSSSLRKPRRKPVAAITWSEPLSSAATRKRPSATAAASAASNRSSGG